MAWRAIQDTVGVSETLAELSDRAERIYWRLLAHSDPWGRLNAKPVKLRGTCMPLLDVTYPQIGEALLELIAVGRIQVYENAGQASVQIVDFEANQPREAFRKRPAESRFPEPHRNGPTSEEIVREKYLSAGVSGEATETGRNGAGTSPGRGEGDGEEIEITPVAVPVPEARPPAAAAEGPGTGTATAEDRDEDELVHDPPQPGLEDRRWKTELDVQTLGGAA